ncbi:AbrB/MazE/SpoVT family DNA-binding domain-containing protein [Companilactobacillus kimchiensis]|uniref:AbrB/MazE/SpoVT family DNA-binding domain-containing protein n=1 Tax=Companilactobacillus kimchiensis TaxID=993692 RepID=UPI000709A781|nr:AbrB/MazE/SpoVT family DNA-binding domain-containing protein [Companilactobacillus kimchiensis]
METKVTKWGNSAGIRLSKDIKESLNIKIGDILTVQVKGDELILKKEEDTPATIQDLFKDYDGEEFKTNEIDWGEKKGHEEW